MIIKKRLKFQLQRLLFSGFFVLISLVGTLFVNTVNVEPVYAEPDDGSSVVVDSSVDTSESNLGDGAEAEEGSSSGNEDNCKSSLGPIGWLVCPTTGKIAEAVDWLYEKIENILVINPTPAEDGSPIYEVWKYLKGVTNIVFIIFLLVVIYSQLTGLGITNYGIKKALPKLIVAAVLVNLSFLICQLAVDASNVIGNGLRGVFTSVAENAIFAGDTAVEVSYTGMFASMIGGAAVAVGAGIIAFEAGAIWMLIPVILGALVAVVTGLVTIALRQAVVALLIMISPLAMVANILPNTEKWFAKWKDLLFRMLIFYPMFSLLFGASQLAGLAIIMSARDGFGLLLGVAVQIFPLFFSWSLMKMSGTFLGNINAKLNALAAAPLATNRAWADSHRQLSKQRHLVGKPILPSMRLMQFVNKRRIAREEETAEKMETAKLRGQAYYSDNYYRKMLNGRKRLTRAGERAYDEYIARGAYMRSIERHKANFDRGVADQFSGSAAQKARLEALDRKAFLTYDYLDMERSRAFRINQENIEGRHKRISNAITAHIDDEYGYRIDENGNKVRRDDYAFQFDDMDQSVGKLAREQYAELSKIMHGDENLAQFAAASAAHARDTQQKVFSNMMQKYAELMPPTREIEYRLDELIKNSRIDDNKEIQDIDGIISYMRVLLQRGDTDLIDDRAKAMIEDKMIEGLTKKGVRAGTHTSQAIASFFQFEVGHAHPLMRRFGKYINLQTAQIFNENVRKNREITFAEYIKGEYEEEDPDHPGETIIKYAKRPMTVLMEGTPFEGVERTSMRSGDKMMRSVYTDEQGNLDVDGFLGKRGEYENAIQSAFIKGVLKETSGSETLKSFVRFKTGYYKKLMVVKDDDGNDVPTNVWVDEWNDDTYSNVSGVDRDKIRAHYMDNTIKFIQSMTPNELLKMRSDFKDPLTFHLARVFEGFNEDELTPEEKAARREYEAERARIQTEYGDDPVDMAKVNRDEALKKAQYKIAGLALRKVLDRGTLYQIVRSRRNNGTVADAKPFVREWLGLNDENFAKEFERMNARLASQPDRNRRPREGQDIESDSPNDSQDTGGVYTDADRDDYMRQIEGLFTDYGSNTEAFYNQVRDFLRNTFPRGNFVMSEFEDFHDRTPNADSSTLFNKLKELLDDLNNY